MNRRHALMAAAAILTSVVAIIIGWTLGQEKKRADEIREAGLPELEAIEGEKAVAELFFPGPGGRLFTEERQIPIQDDLSSHVTLILEELLSGPVAEDLYPALPPEITIGWLHLNPAGVFYVDLRFAGEEPLPGWGSRQEMLAVYSVVNTLLANAPEIGSVVLLRDGQQRPTFAGHLDTSRPLIANQHLIASR